jgi:hypothetical protein
MAPDSCSSARPGLRNLVSRHADNLCLARRVLRLAALVSRGPSRRKARVGRRRRGARGRLPRPAGSTRPLAMGGVARARLLAGTCRARTSHRPQPESQVTISRRACDDRRRRSPARGLVPSVGEDLRSGNLRFGERLVTDLRRHGGGLAVVLLALLLGAARLPGELAAGVAVFVMASGSETTVFAPLGYGAPIGFAGAALLLVPTVRRRRLVAPKLFLLRIVPLIACAAFLTVPVAALTDRLSTRLELDSPWRLLWPGAAVILVGLRLLGRWLGNRGNDDELALLPLGLAALTTLESSMTEVKGSAGRGGPRSDSACSSPRLGGSNGPAASRASGSRRSCASTAYPSPRRSARGSASTRSLATRP